VRKISFQNKDKYDFASAKILKVVVAPVWFHEDRTFFQTTLASQSPKILIWIWRSAWTSLPVNYGIWIRKSVTNICYYTSYWQKISFSLTFPRVFFAMLVNITHITQSVKWWIGILQFRLSCRNIIFYSPSPCDVTLPSKWKETLKELALLVRLKRYGFGFLPVAWCDVCVCVPFCGEKRVLTCVSFCYSFLHSVVFYDRSVAPSKAAPHPVQSSAFPFQFPVSSRFLKVIR